MDIRLVPYTRTYLDRSWTWLNDPEVKALTLTPDFTRAQQEAFYDSLSARPDYHLWGVAAGDAPIGAAGIKHVVGTTGEFWCYIGERGWWGQGVGPRILTLCEEQARDLGLNQLTMVAAADNLRSIRAFEKMGFVLDPEASTAERAWLGKALKS